MLFLKFFTCKCNNFQETSKIFYKSMQKKCFYSITRQYDMLFVFDLILTIISIQMITIHSPKFSTGKTEITKNSPTFRAKRAPSVIENYCTDSMPRITSQSPSKLSADRKRKSHNDNSSNSFSTKHLSKQKGTKEIIDSIQQLKQQYKTLKEAYRQLIQERLKNTHQIAKIRKENEQLQQENQRIFRQSQKIKLQLSFLQQENDRTRREFFKLLEVQKFKAQKLQQSLNQKQQYINQTLLKIRTEADETTVYYPRNGSLVNMAQEDVSLTISQDKSIVIDRSINNQSQFLSFSLTSVLQESTDKELTQSKRKMEHVKAVSELPHVNHQEEKKPKEMHNFKKHKKEFIPKLELTKIESKPNIVKTESILRGGQKRGSKGRVSKSFREKQNKQTLSNKQTLNQNCKKKSKKFINLSGIADI